MKFISFFKNDDGKVLPKCHLSQRYGHESPMKNTYKEFKRLNEEFSFENEYEPKERTRLNTREFSREFI